MSFKKENSVQTYLNGMDTGPLLTRQEEESLIKNIEVYQNQILDAFIDSDYARFELVNYLQSLDSSGENIIDISKKLDDESDESLIKDIEKKFKSLLATLKAGKSSDIRKLIDDVGLSGTIIHGVVTEIKKKHTKIQDVDFKVSTVMKFFPGETFVNVLTKIETSENEMKSKIKSDLNVNDVRASNRYNEWKQVIIDFKDLETIFPKGVSFTDVKKCYNMVFGLENLAKKYKNELIERNLRLVVSRAKMFLNRGLDFDDLIQEGNIGLIKAVDKFDSSKKTKVSTYATWWIDQTIRRSISNKGKTVRVPTHIEWTQMKLSQLVHKMTGELSRPPTVQEISEKSGISVETLKDLQNRPQHEVGIEDEMASGKTYMDILPSDPEDNPYNITEKKLMKEKIRGILSTLSPRTEKIIRLRYGIGELPDDEGTTLQDVANQIGITKQGVRVVECSAFKQLRKRVKNIYD